MKKILLSVLVATTLFSCGKYDITPDINPVVDSVFIKDTIINGKFINHEYDVTYGHNVVGAPILCWITGNGIYDDGDVHKFESERLEDYMKWTVEKKCIKVVGVYNVKSSIVYKAKEYKLIY